MKSTGWIAALALVSAGFLAERGRACLAREDPPPEPVSCPLCGGDPQLHVQRMFAFSEAASHAAALALRW
jgi:hypothetical protein